MIRPATADDIQAMANIDRMTFSGNKPEEYAERWYHCRLAQGEQHPMFVYHDGTDILGYIGWEFLNGFARSTPVIELQKFAVHPDHRGKGVGKELMLTTFETMKQRVAENQPNAEVMRVFLWTKKDNETAAKLYKRICPDIGGERNLLGSDEYLLVGEHPLK